jgi:hypothetical protein
MRNIIDSFYVAARDFSFEHPFATLCISIIAALLVGDFVGYLRGYRKAWGEATDKAEHAPDEQGDSR